MYALGQLNFLSDKSSQPHMAMADLCAAFGVGQSTASAKARVISDALRTNRMDPTWMLRSFVDQNPLVWMAEVNGVLVDLRDMPREVQLIAYEKGMTVGCCPGRAWLVSVFFAKRPLVHLQQVSS